MDLDQIKKLRELTSLGIKECKGALEKADGNFDKALQILRERGVQVMEKRKERSTSQGLIDSYIHFGGNLGALVEVNCETDFVARTEVFKKFVKDIAMQVVAASPEYVTREQIPAPTLETLDNVDTYAKEKCLMEQAFVKDSKLSVRDYLQEVVSQMGENIMVKRFMRFSLGGGDES